MFYKKLFSHDIFLEMTFSFVCVAKKNEPHAHKKEEEEKRMERSVVV